MTKIFRKTDKGVDEIATRANRLVPRLRTALILVDGIRDEAELGQPDRAAPRGDAGRVADAGLHRGGVGRRGAAQEGRGGGAEQEGRRRIGCRRRIREVVRQLSRRGRACVQRSHRPGRRGPGHEDGKGRRRASSSRRCCRWPTRSSATRAARRPPPSSRPGSRASDVGLMRRPARRGRGRGGAFRSAGARRTRDRAAAMTATTPSPSLLDNLCGELMRHAPFAQMQPEHVRQLRRGGQRGLLRARRGGARARRWGRSPALHLLRQGHITGAARHGGAGRQPAVRGGRPVSGGRACSARGR